MIDEKSPRTANYLRQIRGSVVFKVLSVGASFLTVPIMINYLGNEKYGIWSTLLSIISWALLFDFGLSNGTRNRVTEALAKSDEEEARVYISTSYVSIGLFSLLMFSLIFLASALVDWQAIFNTKAIGSAYLCKAVRIVAFFMLLNFTIAIINNLYHAVQRSSFVVFGQFMANLISLVFVIGLSWFSSQSLIWLAWAYGAGLVMASFCLSLIFYAGRPDLVPRFHYFRKERIRDLLGLGIKFFIIQIAALLIFTTDKIIITRMMGPEFVTPYDIVFKLFSIITVTHSMIITPLWSSYTEAYANSDYSWIQYMVKRMLQLMIPIGAGVGILVILSPFIISLWIGSELKIDSQLIMFMGIYVMIAIWNDLFGSLLSGIGKIRLGAVTAAFGGVINIPISIMFARNMGIDGVILGTICSLSLSALISPVQVWHIMFRKKRSPFWNIILS